MSIHKLTLSGVQKIREHLQQSLVLPDLENRPHRVDMDPDADVPEPDSLDALGDLSGRQRFQRRY